MIKFINFTGICVAIIFLMAACSNHNQIPEEDFSNSYQEQEEPHEIIRQVTLADFHGQWQGEITPHNDIWILNIDSTIESVLLTSQNAMLEFLPVDWQVHEDMLVFTLNSSEFLITIVLDVNHDNMDGSFSQPSLFDGDSPISFKRLSQTPESGQFASLPSFTPVSFAQRIEELQEYPDFEDDGVQINFTYDLYRRDLYIDIIEEFGLDELTAGHDDIELMRVLLDWVKDNFRHDGASGMPHNRDAISIIEYMRENPGGINCRGLAILLAEVLRLYGIEAKHITAYPPENDHPVHVVTHAFSRDLKQWIMLDPAFRIYLTDEDGNFMNLYTLRRAFAEGTPLVANANAGNNNNTFNMQDYKDFMSDYLFRFSTDTNFTFGSDNTGPGNSHFMLMPVGFYGASYGRQTTSAEAFFAIPGN